jgi:hypothetical protein
MNIKDVSESMKRRIAKLFIFNDITLSHLFTVI